jgi:hypothetical protein
MSSSGPSELVSPVSELPFQRLCVVAPTDVIHGESAGEPTVSLPDPSLPADVATKMPAARAFRKPT